MRHLLNSCLRLFVTVLLFAAAPGVRAADEFLDPDVAFNLSARTLDERTVELIFTIAPGYYLYREQFKFAASGATLGTPVLPAGKSKFDETFRKTVETYRDVLRISVPVSQAANRIQLLVTNQGCADKGLCYPPQERGVEVQLAGFGGDGSVRMMAATESLAQMSGAAAPLAISQGSSFSASYDTGIDAALYSGKSWTVIGVFFLAGILLSLTPCVLPMLPILSSIIVGQGTQVSRGRGLALAASYSLGMALVYTALGVGAGLAGEGLVAVLQAPWMLALFAAGLVALSLSMFGVYDLRLPSAFSGRLSQASQRLPAGRIASVFAMGGASALIVSPCVAAPLAGALVYLSQTRDVWRGGTALFSLAAGMSVPLLLVGASAGALLPRAGRWMDEVKHFFGLLLLGVALWTVQSALPASLVLALWGGLAIGAAVMLASNGGLGSQHLGWTNRLWRRAFAAVFAVGGLLELAGGASGGSNPLQPLAHLNARSGGEVAHGPVFTTVRSVAELDAALLTAGRPVMLDFYADWCVACKEMEQSTFVDPAVREKMSHALLLRADVTANSANDRALLRRFQLFGPPGTIFFDVQGREVAAARIVGFQDSRSFLNTLRIAGL